MEQKRCKKDTRVQSQFLWPFSQLRLSDAWHNPLPEGFQEQGDPDQEEDPDIIPDPTGAPQFVHDLLARAEEHGAFSDLDSDGDLYIRTWYLHHESFRFCEHPKFLEFSEDWRRWERDIGFAWRHWLRPNEEIQIHVVQPDPYRGYLHRPVHADVVISQGHWMRRFSTLSTIHHHHHQHQPFSYAVACSLPRHIGGVTLATAANVDYWRQQPSLRCRTTFAWIDIPFSIANTHIVQHGQAFTITILDSISIASTASASSTQAVQVQQREPDELSLMHQMRDPGTEGADQEFDMEVDSQHPPTPGAYESSSLHSGDISVLIYRLEEPDAHCFASGRTYMSILEEAIHATQMRRRDVRCFHYVPATPAGVHDTAEEAIILQTVRDVAPGSSEKLILLDLEIHFHPLRGGLLVPAATSRKVLKVTTSLHREQILMLTGLYEYCQVQQQRCVVSKDNELWPANDNRVHQMNHGMYIRIQVPPPLDPDLDTEIAIGIARDLAAEEEPDRDAVAARCRSRASHVSLRQIGTNIQEIDSRWDPRVPLPEHLPGQARRPRQQAQRHQCEFAPGHEGRLRRLLDEADLIECEEEGKVMYVTIWYIHHIRRPSCFEGRSARLQALSDDWCADILQVWQEELDMELPSRLQVIQPPPPCSRFECVQTHIIVEQGSRDQHVSGLVSFRHEPPPQPHRDSWEHRAYSWEQLQSTSSLLQLIGLTTACRHSTCRIMLKGFPFAMFDRLEYLEAADNIAIHIRSDSTTESDRVDLMQRSSSMGRQHAIDMTGRATECEGFQTPHLNPDAPEFIPGVPNLWTQPADINDLYAAWRIGAIDRQAGEPAAQFQVWFLCPEGGYRRCLHPRRVTLWANVDDWREQLSSAWSDHLLPGFPFGIHLVRPNPPHMESDITAHIILTQLFANRAAGVLITIQDDAVNNRLPYRIAVTVPNPCQQSHVRGETGYTHEAASFRLGSGNLNYEEHQAIPTRHGTGLHLIVTHAFLDPRGASSSQSQDVGTGGLNLLQRGISIQSTGSERLTHGAVAQAHGPETSKILALEHLIEAPTNTVAVRLRAGHSDLQVPQYVEIPTPASPENVTAELCHWGLDCVALQFGSNDQFLCFRKDYNVACTGFHYMFCNSDVHDSHGCILHSQANELTQCGMMKLLDSLGYARAVILNIEILPFDMHRVTFCDNVPMFANKSPTERDRNGHSGIRFRGSMDHFTLQNSLSPI